MADTYTPNLNLKKPGYDSPADIADINANMDKIDTAVNQLSQQMANERSKIEVLWSNPNTGDTFASQSIVLSENIDNFTFLIIECVRSNTNSSRIAGIFVCGGISNQYIVFDEYWYRYATGIKGTSITFGDAYSTDPSDNNRIIPSRVYGVKLGGA